MTRLSPRGENHGHTQNVCRIPRRLTSIRRSLCEQPVMTASEAGESSDG